MFYQILVEIKVLLNGQGSDEIFAGYTNHYYAMIADYMAEMQLGKAIEQGRVLTSERRVPVTVIMRRALQELLLTAAPGLIGRARKVPYLNRTYKPDVSRPSGFGPLGNLLAFNLTTASPPEYLRYEDRNSMAFTLETRLPFLDYRLVEWAMALPAELKIEGSASKKVLRDADWNQIPDSIRNRTDKMGFASPQEKWQRSVLKPLIDRTYEQDIETALPFVNQRKIRELYDAYQDGRNNDWALIWRVACLVWWRETWSAK